MQLFLVAGRAQLETECYKKSESVLRGFKRNYIVLNNRIYEPSLIVHDPLLGTTAIFCGQDLIRNDLPLILIGLFEFMEVRFKAGKILCNSIIRFSHSHITAKIVTENFSYAACIVYSRFGLGLPREHYSTIAYCYEYLHWDF